MTEVKLFHKTLLNSEEVNRTGKWSVARYESRHVATAHVNEKELGCTNEFILEMAFMKSNHGVSGEVDNWTENGFWDSVTAMSRSTSSDDIVTLKNDAEDNVIIYNVDGIGWTQIAVLPSGLMA